MCIQQKACACLHFFSELILHFVCLARPSLLSRAVSAYEREQQDSQKRTDVDATDNYNYIQGHCAQQKFKWMDVRNNCAHDLDEEKEKGGMDFNDSSAIDYQDSNAVVPYEDSGEPYQQQQYYDQGHYQQ